MHEEGRVVDSSILKYYKTIGEVQNAIANATTLDEALHSGLRIIVDSCGAESAVIWYADKDAGGVLRPYY